MPKVKDREMLYRELAISTDPDLQQYVKWVTKKVAKKSAKIDDFAGYLKATDWGKDSAAFIPGTSETRMFKK